MTVAVAMHSGPAAAELESSDDPVPSELTDSVSSVALFSETSVAARDVQGLNRATAWWL